MQSPFLFWLDLFALDQEQTGSAVFYSKWCVLRDCLLWTTVICQGGHFEAYLPLLCYYPLAKEKLEVNRRQFPITFKLQWKLSIKGNTFSLVKTCLQFIYRQYYFMYSTFISICFNSSVCSLRISVFFF